MVLCIAEKPSVAREIARILGATAKRDGFIEGNGYAVTWVYGHLCELKEPEDYRPEWKKWDEWDLPIFPERFGIKLKQDGGVSRQFQVIADLLQKADTVINCGDAGQEGELIQQWVLQKAECKLPIKRLWVSSLTDEALKEGFQKLRDNSELQTLYYAGLARAIGDWLLGINATRLYSRRYSQPGKPLSVGRVQTPTLALIVERQREIEHFKPVTTYALQTRYRDTLFRQKKEPFSTEEEAQRKCDEIKNEPLEILKITKKKGQELPPKLFDLTALQVEANKKYKLSAEETLQAIQSLYEQKLTSYPRVDTTYLSDDMWPKIPQILAKLSSQSPYTSLIAPLQKEKALKKTKKIFDNSKITDHHAIIPTGVAPSLPLSGHMAQVYDLVMRRFIAVFYPSCTTSSTVVEAAVADFPFRATGKEIIQPGWRIVYQEVDEDTNKDDDDKNKLLPTFVEGEQGAHLLQVKQKVSEPPKYYTEATLLRAMETAGKLVEDESLREALKQNGIGRPSTRASIIETLFKRGYIVRERNSLRATSLGYFLIDTIQEPLLKSVEMTGLWENKLRLIEKGEYEAAAFIEELKEQIRSLVRNEKLRNYAHT